MPETRGLCLSEEQTVSSVNNFCLAIFIITFVLRYIKSVSLFFYLVNIDTKETKDWG